MSRPDATYIPAAGRHWRLPLYDLLATLLGADAARRVLVEQVAPRPGDRVLDLGAGTGSLAIELERRHPRGTVIGLDPDPKALAIARRKAARAGVSVHFDQGFADALPYPDASFDLVISSFVFHHLSPAVKEAGLGEIRRVLKPGGRFHMLDFAGPATRRTGALARHIHAHPQLHDNAEDRVLGLMRAAGFADVRVVARRAARLTHMCYYAAASATSPVEPPASVQAGR